MDTGFSVLTLQDSASTLYRNNITPLLQRCASYMSNIDGGGGRLLGQEETLSVLSEDEKRSLQHIEGLKWQQEMFHRLLNLICLMKEGLASQQQVDTCKSQVLASLRSSHPQGEWAEFTRDKLLFLQDLLFAACISEEEYHIAMKPLIVRLAGQGAIIDAQDFILNSNSTITSKSNNHNNSSTSIAQDAKLKAKASVTRTPHSRRKTKAKSMAEPESLLMSPAPISDDVQTEEAKKPLAASTSVNSPSSPSSLKHVMLRLSKSPYSSSKSAKEREDAAAGKRVPHALDFLRPRDCPEREPPYPHQQATTCQRSLDFSTISLAPEEEEKTELLPVANPGAVVQKDSTASWSNSPGYTCSSPAKIVTQHFSTSPYKSDTNSPTAPAAGLEGRNSASKSPAKTPSRLRSLFTGFIQKKATHLTADDAHRHSLNDSSDSDNDNEKHGSNRGKWGLDLLRFTKKLQTDHREEEAEEPMGKALGVNHSLENAPLLSLPLDAQKGQGPNTRRLKKKVHSQGAPTDFFIDKVLGENIKNELSRIRAEMSRSQSGQAFTNEQIDAIATRLPVDKTELKKFFPQTWCDRYGDVVLEVVRKEFKVHVGEMQKLGKANRQKSAMSSPSANDENIDGNCQLNHQKHSPQSKISNGRAANFNRCFSTLDENFNAQRGPSSPANSSPSSCRLESPASSGISSKFRNSKKLAPHKRGGGLANCTDTSDHLAQEYPFDRKLDEDNMKTPLKRLNRV